MLFHFVLICDIRHFMPTKNPKLIFVAEDRLLERLEDFRYENRIPTRSEAIRRLLDEALKKYEKPAKKRL